MRQVYLQHAVLERPAVFGNLAFGRFRDAVKVRLQMEANPKKLPAELANVCNEKFFELIAEVYQCGKGGELEGSVVYHMMMHLLQRFAGTPHPQISSKLFALARAMRHIHKPSYDFFRMNTLVGPHVKDMLFRLRIASSASCMFESCKRQF